jgi:hydrogenase maturation protease
MARILIVGVGNTLMGDDGLGVHALELVRSKELPSGVDTLERGKSLIHALPDLTGYEKLILLDAVVTDEDGVVVIRNPEFAGPLHQAISLHELGIEEALRLLLLEMGYLPEVVIMGVRPERIAFGMELSAVTSARTQRLADTVMEEICRDRPAYSKN